MSVFNLVYISVFPLTDGSVVKPKITLHYTYWTISWCSSSFVLSVCLFVLLLDVLLSSPPLCVCLSLLAVFFASCPCFVQSCVPWFSPLLLLLVVYCFFWFHVHLSLLAPVLSASHLFLASLHSPSSSCFRSSRRPRVVGDCSTCVRRRLSTHNNNCYYYFLKRHTKHSVTVATGINRLHGMIRLHFTTETYTKHTLKPRLQRATKLYSTQLAGLQLSCVAIGLCCDRSGGQINIGYT